jgi:protein SCO1/2
MTPSSPSYDPRQRILILAGVALIGVFVIGIAALLLVRAQLAALPTPAPVTASNGVTALDAPRALIDFTLPGKDGAPLALSDLRGAYTLLFFGYTHCPDFCPLTLSEFRQVRRLLGEAGASVQVLFVSVDGARDTPDVLAEYVNRFDPSFQAMQGDEVTLARISADYGLFYEVQRTDPDSASYLVDHTTPSYLIDPEGRLVAVFSFSASPEAIAEYIAAQLAA